MGSTKAKWRNQQLAFYDGSTYETVKPISPIVLYDDFLGDTTNTDFWTVYQAGGGTVAHATSNLTCDVVVAGATDECGITGKDDKAFNVDKGFIFECRLTLATAPTIGAEVVIGVQNDNWGAGANRSFIADEVTKGALFGFYTTVGAGLVAQIRTDDGTTNSGIITTGVTSTLLTYQVFRMDFTTPADVLFYIDGVQVAASTTFDMSAGANLMMQPLVMAQKVGVDAGLANCLIDYVKIWQPTR